MRFSTLLLKFSLPLGLLFSLGGCYAPGSFRDEEGLPMEESRIDEEVRPMSPALAASDAGLSFNFSETETFYDEVPNYQENLDPVAPLETREAQTEAGSHETKEASPPSPSSLSSSSSLAATTIDSSAPSADEELDQGERQRRAVEKWLKDSGDSGSCEDFFSGFQRLAKEDNAPLSKKSWSGTVQWQGISSGKERSYFLILRSLGSKDEEQNAASEAKMLRAERSRCLFHDRRVDLTIRAW